MKVNVLNYIHSLLKEVKFTDEDKFILYWYKLSRVQRDEFFKNLGYEYMKIGTPRCDISKSICDDFTETGLLTDAFIRKFIPNEFKNIYRQKNKLGKTFESMGRDTKETKAFKKIAGEKILTMEIKQVKLELENVKLQKKIVELKEK